MSLFHGYEPRVNLDTDPIMATKYRDQRGDYTCRRSTFYRSNGA